MEFVAELRSLLAPSQTAAVLWAIAFLIVTVLATVALRRRIASLRSAIEHDAPDLFAALGRPGTVSELASPANRPVFMRLRRDEPYAWQFETQVVARCRALQREITIVLMLLGAAGLLVLVLIWPYRPR